MRILYEDVVFFIIDQQGRVKIGGNPHFLKTKSAK